MWWQIVVISACAIASIGCLWLVYKYWHWIADGGFSLTRYDENGFER